MLTNPLGAHNGGVDRYINWGVYVETSIDQMINSPIVFTQWISQHVNKGNYLVGNDIMLTL